MMTVLCAVNETEDARRALRVATRLAERFEMRLLVVHVVEGVPMSPAARREARHDGERLVVQVLGEEGVFHADWRVAVGTPSEEIQAIAAQEAPEMMLVGSKPQSRRWRLPRRSRLASELAGLTSCPVLVVPPGLSAAILEPVKNDV